MTRPCFVANWKMHKTIEETRTYFIALQKKLSELPSQAWDLIIAPPYTAIFSASEQIKALSLPVQLAAQNFHFEAEGAYTGEISSKMLCEAGCQYVIIGHSERRTYFGETNQTVGRKRIAAQQSGLIPIVCVGESAKEREEGKTLSVIKRQIEEAFAETTLGVGLSLVAYEPLWAIGSGKTPMPSDVNKIHQEIAGFFESTLETGKKEIPRILYGGSVNEKNVAAFMKEPHIDGVLAGGASLSAETLVQMIASVVIH
ncbi:MAG: triose-phosphate isomerase [Nitrospirota bacterium]